MDSRSELLLLIPDLEPGGAQRAFQMMGAHLARRFTVASCVLSDRGRREERVRFLEIPGGGPLPLRLLRGIKRILRVRQLRDSLAPRVTISHLEGADYINVLSKGAGRGRVVLCVQGSKIADRDIRGVLGWLRLRVLLPILYARADHIVPVSDALAEELQSEFRLDRRKMTVIPNPCEVEEARRRSREPLALDVATLFEGRHVLLTCGRLHQQKNQASLLRILKLLPAEQFRLVVAGDGPLRHELATTSRAMGFRTFAAWETEEMDSSCDVAFLGNIDNPFALMARSRLFLFPSAWEGLPLALVEALACGSVSIASDCPTGPREILGSNAGVLLPIPTTAEIERCWAREIINLESDESRRVALRSSGQKRAQEFDARKIYDQWAHLITSLGSSSSTTASQ